MISEVLSNLSHSVIPQLSSAHFTLFPTQAQDLRQGCDPPLVHPKSPHCPKQPLKHHPMQAETPHPHPHPYPYPYPTPPCPALPWQAGSTWSPSATAGALGELGNRRNLLHNGCYYYYYFYKVWSMRAMRRCGGRGG